LEDGVLTNMNLDVQISRRPAIAPSLTLAGQPDAIATVDTGRDFHRKHPVATDAALTKARIARIADDGARAPASGARLLQLKKTLRDPHLAGAMASLANGRIGAFRCAAAFTSLTLRETRHFDLDRMAEDRLIQIELELVTQVGATEHLLPAAPPRAEDVA